MYSEAFSRYAVSIYRRMFYALLERLHVLEIPEIKALGVFHLIDGAVFPAIRSMVWASYKKNVNAMTFHFAFELNRMIPAQFLSTTANTSERKMLLQMLEAGITSICDRGYVCFEVFYHICHAGAQFIIRGKCNHVYEVLETYIQQIHFKLIHSLLLYIGITLRRPFEDSTIKNKGNPKSLLFGRHFGLK